jgi:hypothetical protein
MLRSNKKSLFVANKTKEGIHAICCTQAAAKKRTFLGLKNKQVYIRSSFSFCFLFFHFFFMTPFFLYIQCQVLLLHRRPLKI